MSTRQRDKAAARRKARAERGPNATRRYLRMSAKKVRLVTDLIRGRDIEEAINVLTFCPKAAAKPLAKLLRSAVANADTKGGIDLDKLYVKSAFVNEGPTWRRWLPRAHGRATRIRKRTSHITVELGQRT